jgi:hypothetical protein
MQFTCRCLTLVLLATAGGCALTAQRPPTPAADPDLPAPPAVPGVRHFLILFGSQTVPRRPRFTHTWGTAVRVTDCPDGPPAVEAYTISWLPATRRIRPLKLQPEPGVNLDLHETIRHVRCNGEHVVQYGPYEVRPRFFNRFLIQKRFLESGVVGYQAFDTVGGARDGSACACIHAITDMDPDFSRANYPLVLFGVSGARRIVRQIFERGFVLSGEVHGWLNEPLGLCDDPIDRRAYHGRLGPYRFDDSQGCVTPPSPGCTPAGGTAPRNGP